MKKTSALLLFYLIQFNIYSQTEAISHRDDRYLKENAIISLLNSFEISLNVITAGEAYPNEIKTHIDRIISGNKNEKIFFDDLVRIENDLNPADANNKVKEDKVVKDYLEDLISLYKNPESNSIVFDKNYKISGLKRTKYFYYNVVFNYEFKGSDIENRSYLPVSRIAEIRLLNDSNKWYAYINGIRFYTKNEYDPMSDTTNLFNDFLANIGDNDTYIDYLSKLNAEKSKFWEDRDKEVRMLLESGKQLIEQGNVTKADSLISKAWVINPTDRMVLEARADLKNEKDKLSIAKKENEEKMIFIRGLKNKIIDSYNAYDFDIAKQLIDTLYFNYGEKKDTSIENINNSLTKIHSDLDPSMNAISTGRYKDAIKSCDAIIKRQVPNPLHSECFYQKAIALMKMDSTDNISKIIEDLDAAIDDSQKNNMKALSLRASLKRNQKKFNEALSDANSLVSTHAEDQRVYILRASILDAVNRKTEAISDLAMAIKLRSTDPQVFSKKAKLEFETSSYKDAIKTGSDAISKNVTNGDLYYYRALALEKTGDYTSSGQDFIHAKKSLLDTTKAGTFRNIATGYYYNGKSFFDKGNFKNAIEELSKSLLLDTSSQALFLLGKAYKSNNQFDRSEEQFTALICLDKNYTNAYFERGSVRRMKNDMDNAIKDFNTEYDHTKARPALFEKIKTEMQMGKYEVAAKDADNAARFTYDPLAYQYAIESYYKIQKFDMLMQIFEKADGAKSVSSTSYYYYGRTWMDKGELKKAKSNFEKALEKDKNNADASFWSGLGHYQNGEYEDALSMFEQALSSTEFGVDAIYSRAMCRIKMKEVNNFKLAANDLDKTVDSNPKKYRNAETFSWLAYCKLNLNNDNEALKLLNEAKTYDSTNVVYNFVTACYFSKSNNLSVALDFLEKALVKGTKFAKNEIEKEPYFETIRNNSEAKERFKKIIKSHF